MREFKIITQIANALVVGYGATGIARLDIQYYREQDVYMAKCTIYQKDFDNTVDFMIHGDGEVTKL